MHVMLSGISFLFTNFLFCKSMDQEIAIKVHSGDYFMDVRDSPYLCPFSNVRALHSNILLSYLCYLFYDKKT